MQRSRLHIVMWPEPQVCSSNVHAQEPLLPTQENFYREVRCTQSMNSILRIQTLLVSNAFSSSAVITTRSMLPGETALFWQSCNHSNGSDFTRIWPFAEQDGRVPYVKFLSLANFLVWQLLHLSSAIRFCSCTASLQCQLTPQSAN